MEIPSTYVHIAQNPMQFINEMFALAWWFGNPMASLIFHAAWPLRSGEDLPRSGGLRGLHQRLLKRQASCELTKL